MGSVLFVTWDGGGNVNPALSLARQLTMSGTKVTALGPAALQPRFAAAGTEFIARDPAREWDPLATAQDVAEAIDRSGSVAAVIDYMQPGAFCGAELRRVPAAALVHTLYGALLDDGAPRPISMAASAETINGARRSLGLAPVGRLADLLDGAARVLVTCPRELDLPLDDLPANVCYIGAELESVEPTDEWHAPGDPDVPLVCVSLGTTPMDEAPVLQSVLSALGDLAVRVVATVGSHVDRSALDVPANCTLTGYVKHSLVMPRAAVVITHAGLGTVLNALAHGVPLLCIPLGRDQPQNAEAVDRSGAGLTLAASASTDEIREAVQELLASEPLREGAARLASIIQTSALERRGAREVEMIAKSDPHPSGPLPLDQS